MTPKAPPWRGRGEYLVARIARDRSGFAAEGAAWFVLVMSYASRELNIVIAGLVIFALGNVAGIVLGLRRVANGRTGREVGAGAMAVLAGAIGLTIAGALSIVYVFPLNLVLFGICSGDPSVWICVR